jgi:CDP-diglyceride synthetase
MVDPALGLGVYLRLLGFFFASVTAGFALKLGARRLRRTGGPSAGVAGAERHGTVATVPAAAARPRAGIAQKLNAFVGFQMLLLSLAFWSWTGFAAFLAVLFGFSLYEIDVLRRSPAYPPGYGFRPAPAYGLLLLFALAILAYLGVAARTPFSPWTGAPILSFVFLLVAVFDGYSQICGEILGGPRIVPRISPGKTWSGFAGGLAFCAAAAVLGQKLIHPFARPASAAALGLATGALAFLGDISASWVKRRLGIKDFSNLLGPQGGVLDRADSLLWLGPAALTATRLCHVCNL